MTRKRPVKTAATSKKNPARKLEKIWRLKRLGLKTIILRQKLAKIFPLREKKAQKRKKKN